MRRIIYFVLIVVMLFLHPSCGREKPTVIEGRASIKVVCVDTTGVPIENAQVEWISIYGKSPEPVFTDTNGVVEFYDLLSTDYTVSAMKEGQTAGDKLAGEVKIEVYPEETADDTIVCYVVRLGLKINEIYSAGPVNNEYYFSDQFIELYNSSLDTLHLDGVILCRLGGDIDNVTSIFQFPGTPVSGREYPIAPGEFVVLARNPIDHSQLYETSVDLSGADWQIYNPASPQEVDYPDIPNVTNIEAGEHRGWMIGLSSDEIIIATGEDTDYLNGIDLETVIDGVEYQSRLTLEQTLNDAIDRGAAGDGLIKYSGKSIERITAGYDTDNSTVDFHILDRPTPGWSDNMGKK